MAHLISAGNLSLAWLEAMEYLRDNTGSALNLAVAMTCGSEDFRIRKILNKFLDEHGDERLVNLDRVADTIFPSAFYHPQLGGLAEERVYELQSDAREMESRAMGRTYFDRLIDWPVDGKSFNQIERVLEFLRKDYGAGRSKANRYELGVDEVGGETSGMVKEYSLRTQSPGVDIVTWKPYVGFPCLSHISLTVHRGSLNLTAIYRNQHFLAKAYGNYLGLRNLQYFLCSESGYNAGEILCVSTHADAEIRSIKHKPSSKTTLTTGQIRQLLADCRAAVGRKGDIRKSGD